MAAATSSSAPKLTLLQAGPPLTLVHKVEALSAELGLTSTAISKPAVEAIAAQLGMTEAIKGKPLIEQVNACYAAVFSTVSDPSAVTVVNGTATDPAVITVVTGTLVAPASVGPMAAPQPTIRQPPQQQIARASNMTALTGAQGGQGMLSLLTAADVGLTARAAAAKLAAVSAEKVAQAAASEAAAVAAAAASNCTFSASGSWANTARHRRKLSPTGASGSSTGPTQVQVPGKSKQVQAARAEAGAAAVKDITPAAHATPAARALTAAGVAEVQRVLLPRDLPGRAARLQQYLTTVPAPLLRQGPALAHAIRRCRRAPLGRSSDA